MQIKKIFLSLMVLILVLSIPALAAEGDQQQSQDKIAAVVNGEEITLNEVDQYANTQQVLMSVYQANQEFGQLLFQTEAGNKLIREFQKRKMDELITKRLLANEAQKRNLTVSQEEKDKVFNDYIERVKSSNNLNDEQLLNALKQQNINSLEEYKQMFIENSEESLLINKLQEQVLGDVAVSDQEVEDYYNNNQSNFEQAEQVKASHILIEENDERTDEQAKARAEEVLQKLNNGEDFAELAKEYSDGPSASQGGDLGYFNRDSMVKEFSDVAFAMKVGEISQPVKTKYGYHVIKVTDHKEAGIKPLAEVKENIKSSLLNDRQNQKWQEFLRDLRDQAQIEIKL